MTADELIEVLRTFPPGLTVTISDSEHGEQVVAAVVCGDNYMGIRRVLISDRPDP